MPPLQNLGKRSRSETPSLPVHALFDWSHAPIEPSTLCQRNIHAGVDNARDYFRYIAETILECPLDKEPLQAVAGTLESLLDPFLPPVHLPSPTESVVGLCYRFVRDWEVFSEAYMATHPRPSHQQILQAITWDNIPMEPPCDSVLFTHQTTKTTLYSRSPYRAWKTLQYLFTDVNWRALWSAAYRCQALLDHADVLMDKIDEVCGAEQTFSSHQDCVVDNPFNELGNIRASDAEAFLTKHRGTLPRAYPDPEVLRRDTSFHEASLDNVRTGVLQQLILESEEDLNQRYKCLKKIGAEFTEAMGCLPFQLDMVTPLYPRPTPVTGVQDYREHLPALHQYLCLQLLRDQQRRDHNYTLTRNAWAKWENEILQVEIPDWVKTIQTEHQLACLQVRDALQQQLKAHIRNLQLQLKRFELWKAEVLDCYKVLDAVDDLHKPVCELDKPHWSTRQQRALRDTQSQYGNLPEDWPRLDSLNLLDCSGPQETFDLLLKHRPRVSWIDILECLLHYLSFVVWKQEQTQAHKKFKQY